MPSTKKPDELEDNVSVAESSVTEPRKRRRALYYTSNIPDSYIKNAFTGHVYPYKVGSLESLKLYKVMDSSATVDKDGVRLNIKNRPNCQPNILYYDNPEEYMRHRRVKLDGNKINNWKNKVKRLFSNEGKFNKEEWSKMRAEKIEKYKTDFEQRQLNFTNKTKQTEGRKRANSGYGVSCMR